MHLPTKHAHLYSRLAEIPASLGRHTPPAPVTRYPTALSFTLYLITKLINFLFFLIKFFFSETKNISSEPLECVAIFFF